MHFYTLALLHFFISPLLAEDHYRLVITGDMMGAINECDCPGGQPGGLARRKSIFDDVRAETPDAVFIDCGKLFNEAMSKPELNLGWKLTNLLEYDLVGGTEWDNEALSDPDNTSIIVTYYKDQTLRLFDGSLNIFSKIEDKPTGIEWRTSTSFRGLSTVILNEDNIDNLSELIDAEIEFVSPLDVIIFYGSGYIAPDVELYTINYSDRISDGITKDILIARPGMHGEYVLVIDLWTENGSEISRFEWESIATEMYPPDSTFQAEIDVIYKDKIDSRKK